MNRVEARLILYFKYHEIKLLPTPTQEGEEIVNIFQVGTNFESSFKLCKNIVCT